MPFDFIILFNLKKILARKKRIRGKKKIAKQGKIKIWKKL